MSHIPNAAIPHAKPHHPEADLAPATEQAPDREATARERVEAAGRSALDLIKANRGTAAAIGATLVAGAAAAIAVPLVRSKAESPKRRRKAPTKADAAA